MDVRWIANLAVLFRYLSTISNIVSMLCVEQPKTTWQLSLFQRFSLHCMTLTLMFASRLGTKSPDYKVREPLRLGCFFRQTPIVSYAATCSSMQPMPMIPAPCPY